MTMNISLNGGNLIRTYRIEFYELEAADHQDETRLTTLVMSFYWQCHASPSYIRRATVR